MKRMTKKELMHIIGLRDQQISQMKTDLETARTRLAENNGLIVEQREANATLFGNLTVANARATHNAERWEASQKALEEYREEVTRTIGEMAIAQKAERTAYERALRVVSTPVA